MSRVIEGVNGMARPSSERTELGRRIEELMNAKDWSQAKLAEEVRRVNPRLKTGQTTIGNILTGVSRNPTIITEIAKALGVTAEYLKTGREPTTLEQAARAPDIIYGVLEEVMQTGDYDPDEVLALTHIVRQVSEGLLAQTPRASREQIRIAVRRYLIQQAGLKART